MRKRRISEREADAVLSGRAPASRPDLAPLADAIAEFRVAAFESPVGPSTALTERLGLQRGPMTSSRIDPKPAGSESRKNKRVKTFSWIAGFGLVAKIALGAGVAVAATAGAGVAGVLPAGAQNAFNAVVSTVIPASHVDEPIVPETDVGTPSPDPAVTDHPDNFGGSASERAKDPQKDGRTFGHETSEAAHENGNGIEDVPEKGNGHAPSSEDPGKNNGPDSSDDAANKGSGDAVGHGKSEHKPTKP